MDSTAESALTTTLGQLYAALADADPLAAPPWPVTSGVRAVVDAFQTAESEQQARMLLRALDEAIAALEVAAALAEAHARRSAAPEVAAGGEDGPLAATYAAFAASQSTYQALYHYRNALAAHLRLERRPLPEAVAAPQPTEEPPPPEH
jgi:hypothetical protein